MLKVKKLKKHTQSYWKKQLDPLMSKLCRSKGYCERCGRRGDWKFDWSHIISRGNLTLRWDIMNCFCFCYPCHQWWHEQPTESGIWFKENHPGRYEYLMKYKDRVIKRTEEDYLELKEHISNKQIDKLHYE